MLVTAPHAFAQPSPTAEPPSAEPPATAPSVAPPAACPPDALCEEVDVEPPEVDEPLDEASSEDERAAPADDGRTPPLAAPEPGMKVGDPLDSEVADWDPSPSGRAKPTTPAEDMVTAGAVIFVVGYVPALGIGVVAAAMEDGDDQDQADAEEYLPMLIPAVGPPITGALVHASGVVWGLLIADTAVQVIGLALLGVGIGMPDDPPSAAGPRIVPILIGDGRRSLGAGLGGAF